MLCTCVFWPRFICTVKWDCVELRGWKRLRCWALQPTIHTVPSRWAITWQRCNIMPARTSYLNPWGNPVRPTIHTDIHLKSLMIALAVILRSIAASVAVHDAHDAATKCTRPCNLSLTVWGAQDTSHKGSTTKETPQPKSDVWIRVARRWVFG